MLNPWCEGHRFWLALRRQWDRHLDAKDVPEYKDDIILQRVNDDEQSGNNKEMQEDPRTCSPSWR